MKIPYPLPPKFPEALLSSGDLHLFPGYSIRIDDNGVHYLIYGGEDLLGKWSMKDLAKDGAAKARRRISRRIAVHRTIRMNMRIHL